MPEWGTDAYPAPIVDEAQALQHAKSVLYGLRDSPQAQAEARQIQLKHGSRRAGLPPSGRQGAPRRQAAPRGASPASSHHEAQAELFT